MLSRIYSIYQYSKYMSILDYIKPASHQAIFHVLLLGLIKLRVCHLRYTSSANLISFEDHLKV
jgi:hypothetical protein